MKELETFLRNTEKNNYAVALFSEPGDPFFQLFAQSLDKIPEQSSERKFYFKSFHYSTNCPDIVIHPEMEIRYVVDEFPVSEATHELNTWKGHHPNPIISSQENFENGVHQLKKIFETTNVRKAMLSAVRNFPIEKNFSITQYLFRLKALYPNTFISFVSTPFSGTWIGATPELLLKRKKNVVETISLAGTKTVDSDQPWTSKEKDEQEWVSMHIREVLEPLGKLDIHGPHDFHTGHLVHLQTAFQLTADANSLQENWAKIAADLHPTPAVGGYPKNESIEVIKSIEAHNREYYAGYLGVNDPEQTFLYVNLRCMRLFTDQCYIFTGAGITRESDASSEWKETGYKAGILLKGFDA